MESSFSFYLFSAFSHRQATPHLWPAQVSAERGQLCHPTRAMLQHELVFASSLTAYRHCAGPCTDQPCRTHTRHKTQPKSFALIISTEFGHASQSRFCLQVLKMKGASGFIGCLRAASMEASNAGFPGEGKAGHWQLQEGKEGQTLCCLGGKPELLLNHCPTVIYCIPPGACRPLGMSHLLPAHSPAPAHSSLPRERTPQSHVLPSAKSHAVERRLRARKLGQFQLSAPAEELPNVSACKSSAQIKVPGEAGDWLCQPVLQQTQCSLSAGSCLKKLPERMKPSILQACITLHSGEG